MEEWRGEKWKSDEEIKKVEERSGRVKKWMRVVEEWRREKWGQDGEEKEDGNENIGLGKSYSWGYSKEVTKDM